MLKTYRWIGRNRKNASFKSSNIAGQCALLCLAWSIANSGFGQAASTNAFSDLTNLSLDQLVNIQVTSVSKKETPLSQSAAAISVITQEDIRRSGLTSIPELLRLVPGMDVAQINASEWAVSARGFNGQYANKLLVMVDGRSIYNPVFAGVRWDAQDLVLEDLERIEVIRGPGATLWGANAVNGVINIITKSAKETQGLLVSTTVGSEQLPSTSIRYGGELATNLYYRAYVKYVNNEGFVDSMGNGVPDNWNSIRGGMRMDWEPNYGDRFTLQGDYYQGAFGQPTQVPVLTPPYVTNFFAVNDASGGNVLGRWTHGFSDTAELTLQAYYDHAVMNDADYHGIVDTYDVDLQHKFDWGERQEFVLGAGYRYSPTYNSQASFIQWNPQSRHDQLFSAFAQDDITLVENRLHAIVGSKFERNDFTGFEVEPSGRLLWTPAEKQTVWGAVSRAVRTPSEFERDSIYNATVVPPAGPGMPPTLVQVFGNPDFVSEKMVSYELGYRIQPADKLSFDFAGFYSFYNSLEFANFSGAPTFVAAPTPYVLVPETFLNAESGQSRGFELSAQWQVLEDWRLTASYSLLKTRFQQQPSLDFADPQQQFQLHSYVNLPHHVELNAGFYYVDQIYPMNSQVQVPIHSYARVDLGVAWRPSKSFEIGIWGENLQSAHHAEFPSSRTTFQTEVPRSVVSRLTWHF